MTKVLRVASLGVLALLSVTAAKSTPTSHTSEVALYSGVAPGSENTKQVEGRQTIFGQSVVVNVTKPTLTPILPQRTKSTGVAVIVAPGGAFKMLSIDSEGFKAAEWLADRGVAAFVLKYRLDATPANPEAFKKDLTATFAGVTSGVALPAHPQAIADVQAAMKLVRQHSNEWHIDPQRVGVLGFSAGADAALKAVLADDSASRPDFAALIYGPVDSVTAPADAPPLFVAFAADDPIFGGRGFGLVEAWMKASRPVELHMYEKGGHGFGMRPQGTTSDHWVDEFYAWLKSRGLLETSKPQERK